MSTSPRVGLRLGRGGSAVHGDIDIHAVASHADAAGHAEPASFTSASGVEDTPEGSGMELPKKKRVLIIMSDTGGGHKASAQAISAALDELYPNRVECNILDIWTDYGVWPFNTAVRSYQYLAKRPLLWKITYEYGRFPITQWLTQRICAIECFGGVKRAFLQHEPDMVISVHPLCQHLPLRVLNYLHGGAEERKAKMPFVTVVTDLGGGHPLWFHRKVDYCFVPSDQVVQLAKRKGMVEDKLRKHGLPIRPGFGKAENAKEELRRQLGLVSGVRTALIVGGGDGVGRLGKITKALANELHEDGGGPAQLAVICGKNAELKQKLEAEDWPASVHVSVQGFVRNMDEWMGAADCIITKAGPGTIAEACATGLPIMLSGYLPGQEAGNVPFVVKGGFGGFSTRPKVIAKTVSGWLKDPQKIAEMSGKSRKAGRPEATTAIAKDIGQLLFPQG
mmetsp:Transcript_6942/g.26763  ORF Transcript_6942/g.26763 Transcript_6942/m.26763 type:complete len:450 (-) Transcript_6942:77-1426(-)